MGIEENRVPDPLSVEDASGNDLGKTLDLPGMAYSAHIDRAHKEIQMKTRFTL